MITIVNRRSYNTHTYYHRNHSSIPEIKASFLIVAFATPTNPNKIAFVISSDKLLYKAGAHTENAIILIITDLTTSQNQTTSNSYY